MVSCLGEAGGELLFAIVDVDDEVVVVETGGTIGFTSGWEFWGSGIGCGKGGCDALDTGFFASVSTW